MFKSLVTNGKVKTLIPNEDYVEKQIYDTICHFYSGIPDIRTQNNVWMLDQTLKTLYRCLYGKGVRKLRVHVINSLPRQPDCPRRNDFVQSGDTEAKVELEGASIIDLFIPIIHTYLPFAYNRADLLDMVKTIEYYAEEMPGFETASLLYMDKSGKELKKLMKVEIKEAVEKFVTEYFRPLIKVSDFEFYDKKRYVACCGIEAGKCMHGLALAAKKILYPGLTQQTMIVGIKNYLLHGMTPLEVTVNHVGTLVCQIGISAELVDHQEIAKIRGMVCEALNDKYTHVSTSPYDVETYVKDMRFADVNITTYITSNKYKIQVESRRDTFDKCKRMRHEIVSVEEIEQL